MIPMPMGDHRPLHPLPGIEVEPAGLAEQAAVVDAEEGLGVRIIHGMNDNHSRRE